MNPTTTDKSINGSKRVSQAQSRLAFADALRATAIFAVVFHHLVYTTRPQIGHGRPYELGYLGVWGVNCFFVLSGFLLGRPYLAALVNPTRALPSLRLFLSRRFLRIYPLYAVAIVFSIVVATVGLHVTLGAGDIASHLTMTHTFFPAFATSLNGPLWTMPVDAEFYLLLPLWAFALSLLLRGKSRTTRVRVLAATLTATIAFSIGFRYVQYVAHPDAIANFAVDVVYVRNVLGFSGTFAIGMLLALIVMLTREDFRARSGFYAGLVIAGIVLALLQLSSRFQPNAGPPTAYALLRFSFWEIIAALSVAMILYGLAESRSAFLARITHSNAVARLAAVSYAVYLLHWPIIGFIEGFFHNRSGNVAFVEATIFGLGLTLIIAGIAHTYVEQPFLNMKDLLREPSTLTRSGDPVAKVAPLGTVRPGIAHSEEAEIV